MWHLIFILYSVGRQHEKYIDFSELDSARGTSGELLKQMIDMPYDLVLN